MEPNRCLICGAVISDNNTTGVGYGCVANVVKPAAKDTLFQFKGLDFWIWKSTMVKNAFLEHFKDTKFRNEFRKNFYASMQTAEHISKKQFDIMNQMLEYDFVEVFQKDAVKNWLKFEELQLLSNLTDEQRDFYQKRISYYKKQYLSKRRNHEDKED